MLPNLPPLANWTDFRWNKTNTQGEQETLTKNCSTRPKLIDIQEGFSFYTQMSPENKMFIYFEF